jgi:hypothetical protein
MYRLKIKTLNDYYVTSIIRNRHGDISEINISSLDLTKHFWKSKKINTAERLLNEIKMYCFKNEKDHTIYDIEEFSR